MCSAAMHKRLICENHRCASDAAIMRVYISVLAECNTLAQSKKTGKALARAIYPSPLHVDCAIASSSHLQFTAQQVLLHS